MLGEFLDVEWNVISSFFCVTKINLCFALFAIHVGILKLDKASSVESLPEMLTSDSEGSYVGLSSPRDLQSPDFTTGFHAEKVEVRAHSPCCFNVSVSDTSKTKPLVLLGTYYLQSFVASSVPLPSLLHLSDLSCGTTVMVVKYGSQVVNHKAFVIIKWYT